MPTWDSVQTGDRVELGLLQVDIVSHSKLRGNDRALQQAKSIFRQQMEAIARSRNGRLFNWAGDGGSFMFLTSAGQHGFDDLAFSAIQMLQNMSAINEEIGIRTDLDSPLSVRISGDVGTATYTLDPSTITGDFINLFLKNERTLGLANTVALTERVWKQLSRKLRERFVPFKVSAEVKAKIYSYGGKELQADVLQSLRNVDHTGPVESPLKEGAYVEVVAFEGDTLASLSTSAYGDVSVQGFDNIGGINLLMVKNAVRRREDSDLNEQNLNFEELSGEQREILQHLLRGCPEVQPIVVAHLRKLSSTQRREIFRGLRESHDYGRRIIERAMEGYSPKDTYHSNLFEPFEGGETIRFYNTTALGLAPEIGDGTLLDHVFAKTLRIKRVIGGVPEPVRKRRIFERRRGEYVELEMPSKEEDDLTEENLE